MAELLNTKVRHGRKKEHVLVKVGMIGESQTGKTSLMVRYVQNIFAEDYIETLGVNYMNVNFMEKTIKLKNVTVTLNIWDLGGQKEYLKLMPLVCKDAKALLFVFDLTRKKSLSLIREWYREARKENKNAIPFLVGAKYDLFNKKDTFFRDDITAQARKFSKAMKAPLIYTSSAVGTNIRKIFQLVVAKLFHLRPKLTEQKKNTEPILEWKILLGKSTSRSKSTDKGVWPSKHSERKENSSEIRKTRRSHSCSAGEKSKAKEQTKDEMNALVLEVNKAELGTVNIEHAFV
jgi:GTP-binding protein of the ras superfamily involved in termination of M-phase